MAIKTGKRELIDTGTDKRFVKRAKDGTFKESVDVGRTHVAKWIRNSIEWLVAYQQLDQAFTRVVSTRAIYGKDWDLV